MQVVQTGSLCRAKTRPFPYGRPNVNISSWKRKQRLSRSNARRVVYATRLPQSTLEMLQDTPYVTRTSLVNPAEIGSACRTTVYVQDAGGEVSLDRYMRLPVEQYSELDPAIICPLGGNSFALRVPRIHILNVWLEPVVEVLAELENDQVLISSTRCQIRGSDLVERLQLNKRFCMSFTNKLTWTSAPVASTQGPLVSLGATSNGTEAAAASALPAAAPPSESGKLRPGDASASSSRGFMDRLAHPFGRSKGSKDASGGAIHGDSKLEVWVEVLGPFRIFPREFLQATANAVLAGLMRTLLPIFTRKLAADYRRWATDAEYRERRASLMAQAAGTSPTS